MGSTARSAVGRYGEELAARHLAARGLTVVARNWRCRDGEVDIIARDGDVLVMCEVKTRRSVRFGTPLDAVTAAKAARLRKLAIRWLAEERASSDAVRTYGSVRFDVVSVVLPPRGAAVVEHLEAAF